MFFLVFLGKTSGDFCRLQEREKEGMYCRVGFGNSVGRVRRMNGADEGTGCCRWIGPRARGRGGERRAGAKRCIDAAAAARAHRFTATMVRASVCVGGILSSLGEFGICVRASM